MAKSELRGTDLPLVSQYGIDFTSERAVTLPDASRRWLGPLLWLILFFWLVYCFILVNSEPMYGFGYLIEDASRFWKWGPAQQFWTVVFPLWYVIPLAGLAYLVRWDYASQDLDVLPQSRVLLSAFDRQSVIWWMAGTAVLTLIYLPMYALKRRRLSRIARFTIEQEWYVTEEEASRLHGRQRLNVIGVWVVLLACPSAGLWFLLTVLEMLSSLAGW